MLIKADVSASAERKYGQHHLLLACTVLSRGVFITSAANFMQNGMYLLGQVSAIRHLQAPLIPLQSKVVPMAIAFTALNPSAPP